MPTRGSRGAMPLSGELPPNQQGGSDRQFTRDAAIGNIIGRARSWGPLPVIGHTGQRCGAGVVGRLRDEFGDHC